MPWLLFYFNRCYSYKNGGRNWLKKENLPFWAKFKAFVDRFLNNLISAQANTKKKNL